MSVYESVSRLCAAGGVAVALVFGGAAAVSAQDPAAQSKPPVQGTTGVEAGSVPASPHQMETLRGSQKPAATTGATPAPETGAGTVPSSPHQQHVIQPGTQPSN